MFVILVYDVNAKRDRKMKKVCEQYLNHIQNSVFEGMITESKLEKLKHRLQHIMDTETDQCTIYKMESLRYTSKDEIGRVDKPSNIL